MISLCIQAAKYNDGTAENCELVKKFEKKAYGCDSIAYWITIVFFTIILLLHATFMGSQLIYRDTGNWNTCRTGSGC